MCEGDGAGSTERETEARLVASRTTSDECEVVDPCTKKE